MCGVRNNILLSVVIFIYCYKRQMGCAPPFLLPCVMCHPCLIGTWAPLAMGWAHSPYLYVVPPSIDALACCAMHWCVALTCTMRPLLPQACGLRCPNNCWHVDCWHDHQVLALKHACGQGVACGARNFMGMGADKHHPKPIAIQWCYESSMRWHCETSTRWRYESSA